MKGLSSNELDTFTSDKLDECMIHIAARVKDELIVALRTYFASCIYFASDDYLTSANVPIQFIIETEALGLLRKYRTKTVNGPVNASEGDYFTGHKDKDTTEKYCFKDPTPCDSPLEIRQRTIKFNFSFIGKDKWLIKTIGLLDQVEKKTDK